MARALLALCYSAFWEFIRCTSRRTHHAYIHARWRIFQERRILQQFLKG